MCSSILTVNQLTRTIEELGTYVVLHGKDHVLDIKKMIKMLKYTTIDLAKDHVDKANKTLIRVWEKKVNLCIKRRETYHSNKRALYHVLWGQCSKNCILDQDSNSLELIRIFKGIAYKFESQQNIKFALDKAKCLFYAYWPEKRRMRVINRSFKIQLRL